MGKYYVNCIDCGIKVDIGEDSSDLMRYCSRCHDLRNTKTALAEAQAVIGRVEIQAELIWPIVNRARGLLIDKKIAGTLTSEERVQLEIMTKYTDAYIDRIAPRDSAIRALLILTPAPATEGGDAARVEALTKINRRIRNFNDDVIMWVGAANHRAEKAEADLAERTCEWEEYEGMWRPGCCGETWEFTDGGPRENAVTHCMFCGSPIILATEKDGE